MVRTTYSLTAAIYAMQDVSGPLDTCGCDLECGRLRVRVPSETTFSRSFLCTPSFRTDEDSRLFDAGAVNVHTSHLSEAFIGIHGNKEGNRYGRQLHLYRIHATLWS
uniref:Uncharacterized protein n=1 Tax=Hyaloperonospora arabidopsidis (strain Emoy2) TaxID=559515 RepID=M4BTA5_HYAAE